LTSKVLIVDDIAANVKLLQVRLEAEAFDVITAYNGREALGICAVESVDVILLDVMMPGMDGFEVCRRLKAGPATQNTPVVIVSALDQMADQCAGLDAGADDFLTKPIDDFALVTRVKNLAGLKNLSDEVSSCLMINVHGRSADKEPVKKRVEYDCGGRILLVEDHPRNAERFMSMVANTYLVDIEEQASCISQRLGHHMYDVVIVSLGLKDMDGLDLCRQLRSLERMQHVPVMVVVERGDEQRLLSCLDMGINDYLMRPLDKRQFLTRVRTQIKRKRYLDILHNRAGKTLKKAP